MTFLRPTGASQSNIVLAHRYNKVVLRIALYPLISCFFNLVAASATLLYTIRDGIHDETDVRVDLLSNFVYGGRPIFYAILTAFDPALIRGVKILVQETGVLSSWKRTPHSSELHLPSRHGKTRKGGPVDSIFYSGSESTIGQLPVIHVRDSRVSSPEYPPQAELVLEVPMESRPLSHPEIKGLDGRRTPDSLLGGEKLEDKFIARI
jgi:hypothetical protein